METNKIYKGNCLEILKTFPDNSIDCVVTSPPYWACRDYGEQNEVIWDGLEGCEHEFEIKERKIHSGTSSKNINPAIDSEGGFKTDWNHTDKYCKKCGYGISSRKRFLNKQKWLINEKNKSILYENKISN